MARHRHALLTPLTAVILLHHARQPASAETTLSIPARLRDDVAAYLPACAVPCLASFIAANYARGDYTDQYLTLDFVCAHRGRSGYTLAEGTLQCLTAERIVGFCDDGTIDVKVNQICSGRKDVAKNKGGAMTATLRYASQSGVLTFAPITTSLSAVPIPTPMETSTTSTSSSTSSFSETTLMTATSTRSSSTITTSTPLSSHTITSSPTSTPEAPAADTSSPPPFSKGQIAGITIGAICLAAGVAFGLILLVRFLRRRRRRHSSSTIGSFIGGGPPGGGGGGGGGGHAGYMTARDTWGYGFDKTSNSNGSSSASWATREAPGMSRYPAMPGAATATASNSSSSGGGGHTKQQQRQQQLHHHHQPYSHESWRPSAIGLAISPSKLFASRRTPTPTSTPTRPRPLSKLLPAKPDMTPANAIRTGLSPPPPPPPPPAATYQETREAQASQQQSFLHPIAAQFMRPYAATAAAAAARPTSLRLVIPDSQPLPPPPPPPVPEKELHLQRQPILGRESTLTEFEEDDLHRSASTAVGQIWRPPSLLPDSAVAAPYYVADGSGNWVLGDAHKSMIAGAGASGKEPIRPQSPEPESAVSAPRIATARSGIVTTAVQTHIMAPRRSPAMLTSRDETAHATMDKHTQQQQQQQQQRPHCNNEPQELEASPLLPPSRDKQRSAKQETTQLGAATPAPPKTPRIRSIVHTSKTVPSPLFSRQPNPRSASQPLPTTSEGRLFTVRPAPSRVMSDDSGITTFSVSSATSDDMPPPLPAPSNRNLSPVAESPRGRAASRAAVQELSNSNAAVHELAATVAAASDHSRSSSNGGGGASSASYPPRITGRSTPAPRDPAVLPGSALSPPPPPRMALLSSQPSASQSSPTLGSVTRPHQGHANAASFQRQPPLPSSPYHGVPEAARGGMARGRGRGGSMMTMMRPPPSDMPRDPTRLAPPQVQQHPRTGSPTMRIVEPSPEPEPAHPTPTITTTAPTRDDRFLLPSAAITTRPPRRRPPSHLPHPFPMYPLRRNPPPTQQQQQQSDSAPPPCAAPYITPPPPPSSSSSSPRRRGDNNDNDNSSSSSLSRYPGHPMPIPQPYKPRAAPSPRAAALLRSDYDPAAHDNSSQEALADASSSSSLLAKRLGSTRAADMALPTQSSRERERRWQQVPQQHHQQQQQAGEGRMQKRTQDTEYLATPELPSTPTWVPRLTPTRRGEDLVLNVG